MRMIKLGVVGVSLLLLSTQVGAESTVTVLPGLHNPRGVAVGPAGRVFVAESGTGVAGSGRISQWWRGKSSVVLGGLASVIDDTGAVAGPAGVDLTGLGQVYFTYAGAGNAGANGPFSSLQRATPHLKPVADIAAYDAAHPEPTAGPPESDSDSYGIAAIGNGVLVTDAAANNLKWVSPNGSIQVVARFPNVLVPAPFPGLPNPFPAQAVPTSVAVGPDGWWYVGELTGFPFPVGKSRIWKIRPGTINASCDPASGPGAACQLVASDFTAIVGLAFGPDGSMYVSEMARGGLLAVLVLPNPPPSAFEGALIKVATNGARTELAAGKLTLPGGVAVAGDGSVFVANNSISDNDGSLVKINE